MNAWVVRSGGRTESDVSHLFNQHSCAAIDWEGWFGDLSHSSHEEIKAICMVHCNNAGTAGRVAGEIFSFVTKIAEGDLIITPPTANRGDVLIGRCKEPYKYIPALMMADNLDTYSHVIRVTWHADRFSKSQFSIGLQNSLGTQGTLFSVTKHIEEIEALCGAVPSQSSADSRDTNDEEAWSQQDVASLAGELLWTPEQLQEIIDDLLEKRQAIFYGPPGTGKTYAARVIAQHSRKHGGNFEIVQFHPSYSYEDFVQGYRPRLIEGQPGFKLVKGPLLRIAKQAADKPNATFILVIDELNRGNVAKVFGELYFLLEYRREEMRLQYSGDDGEGFRLPDNLWFICTMNTADRNIALMDAALRRRFYFAPFFPDEEPIAGLLRRWIDKHKPGSEWVADLVNLANSKLERDMGIGPSYFMDVERPLDENRVRRVWKRAVLPYLEEQCGDSEILKGFEFNRLQQQLNQASSLTASTYEEVEPQQASDDAARAE